MESETKYHVMFLNPVQKAALKLIIFNYISLRIKGTIDDVADQAIASNEGVSQILDDLAYYESLTGKLPHVNYVSDAKGEVLMFVTKAFSFVYQAISVYDHKHNMLSDNQDSLIGAEYNKIKKLADESNHYQYTKSEIRGK
jgi:hypothetical protein